MIIKEFSLNNINLLLVLFEIWGRRFDSNQYLLLATQQIVSGFDESWYHTMYEKCLHQHKRCMEVKGLRRFEEWHNKNPVKTWRYETTTSANVSSECGVLWGHWGRLGKMKIFPFLHETQFWKFEYQFSLCSILLYSNLNLIRCFIKKFWY